MKILRVTIFVAFLVVISLAVPTLAKLAAQQPPPNPFSRLVQVSDREFVDPSKIDYIEMPINTPPVAGCPDCQSRWGAIMVVDGVSLTFTEAAEAQLRQLLKK